MEQEDRPAETLELDTLRARERELEDFKAWCEEERAPIQQSEARAELVRDLKALAEVRKDARLPRRTSVFIERRAAELIEQAHDLAHRHGLSLQPLLETRSRLAAWQR